MGITEKQSLQPDQEVGNVPLHTHDGILNLTVRRAILSREVEGPYGTEPSAELVYIAGVGHDEKFKPLFGVGLEEVTTTGAVVDIFSMDGNNSWVEDPEAIGGVLDVAAGQHGFWRTRVRPSNIAVPLETLEQVGFAPTPGPRHLGMLTLEHNIRDHAVAPLVHPEQIVSA